MQEKINSRLKELDGNISFWYQNLVTGEAYSYQEDFAHTAASIIKIPVMIEAFRRFEEGTAREDTLVTLKNEHRVPICGVLTLMHEGLEVTLMDLIYLMISISDNVATNLLIEYLGIDRIQQTIEELGMKNTCLSRKLFERDPAFYGKRNLIAAGDMGNTLLGLYRGEIISQAASRRMLDVLSTQQLNNKIPFFLPLDMHIAHKTGEDDNVTHDVGIVYAKQPFIVCFCGSQTDAPALNHAMGEISKWLFDQAGGLEEEA